MGLQDADQFIESNYEMNVNDKYGLNTLWQKLKQFSENINKERAAPFVVDLGNKNMKPDNQLICHKLDTARKANELKKIKEIFVEKLSEHDVAKSQNTNIKNVKFLNSTASNIFKNSSENSSMAGKLIFKRQG